MKDAGKNATAAKCSAARRQPCCWARQSRTSSISLRQAPDRGIAPDQVERRAQAGGLGDVDIDHAFDIDPAQRGRHQRHAQAGGHQAQGGQHARRFLRHARAEAGGRAAEMTASYRPGPLWRRYRMKDSSASSDSAMRFLGRPDHRMVGGKGRQHGFLQHAFHHHVAAGALGATDEGRVDPALGHGLGQLAGAAFLEHQPHIGRGIAKAPDHGRHEGVEGRRAGEAHCQPAGLAARHLAHAVHGLVHQRDDVARVRQQRAAAFGQFHAARQTVEQRHAQFLLQRADLLAERRLTDAQAFGGLGQVGFLGHRQEVAQQAQIDGCHIH